VSSGLLVTGLVGWYIYLGREPDEKIDLDHKTTIGAWIGRSNRRTLDTFDYFNKPIWKELLPPPLPAGYQKPYTLILSIDDLLITSVWDRQNGWRTAKRPGVDYFLQYLSQFFEIVIFTTQQAQTAYPILDKLDPFQFSILYQLFRESTRSVNGKIVKDLSYLNRDLSKVIAVDTVAERYSSQPENVIILPKWEGDPKDTGLIGLIPFLESIGILNPPDVRPVLTAYQGKDIATEYAKVEAANKARIVEELKAKHKSNTGLASGGFTISRLFSRDPDPMHNLPSNSPDGIPLTYLEQKRLLAQQQYRGDIEFLRKNHDMLKKQKEEAQEAQMKEMMQDGLWGALSRLGLGPTPPKDPNAPPSTPPAKQG